MPLPSTPPSGPTRAPLLPRFCELEETDDWHECCDLPQAESSFSRNVSTFSTESTPMTTGRAMVSGSASPVGSGPSQIVRSWDMTSGYRTPDRPRGFIRCFERREPDPVPKRRQSTSSIDQLSKEALLAPARELRRMSLTPPVDPEKAKKELEETKKLLEKCVSELTEQKMYDQMLEKFRPFLTALSRAEQLIRRESPEIVLGFLEPKGKILRFLLELHLQKRQYRRQTNCSLNTLLQCDSWLEAYHREGLLAQTPQELLLSLPMLQHRPPSVQLPSPAPPTLLEAPAPATVVISPTRRAAVEADVKVLREKRLRRATRRPDESLEDLLIKSRDQAEALDYAAGGDPDEVQVAFETFHRAVRQAFEKKAATKGRLSLEGFESKQQMAAFLVDVGVKRKAWRSRVFYVLAKLSELEAWQIQLGTKEVQAFLDSQAQSPTSRSPACVSPSAESPQHSEPEPEQSAPQVKVPLGALSPTQVEEGAGLGWRDLARQKAPWYLRVCFSLLGVDRTLRFCKCLVPRDIHQMADWTLRDDLKSLQDQLTS